MRGDRDEKAWAFESAVEKALWWMLRSTLGRALRLMLRLWRGSKIFRITSYAGAGILVTAGIAFTSVRIYENRHASIHVGPGAYELSLRGDRFSIYTPKGIEVWNLDKRRRIGTVRDGDQTPDFMSPDGRLLAGGVQHGEYPEHTVEDIRIRRTEDGSVIRMIDTAKDTGWPVWSPDGELIAALTPDAIQVVRVRDGRLLTSIEGYPPLAEDPVPIVLSPDGRFLAMKGERGGIALWDVTSGRYLRTLEGDFESGISFSPDGRLFAEGGTPVKLRSTPDGSVVRKLRSGEPAGSVYASSVLAVAFFPDGRHIASHGSDETVRVWPVEDYGLEDER